MSSASELANQLHVYHNPFAGATQQPKIPDGKASSSLGYSTQSVYTIGNSSTQDVLHVLLFPGLSGSVIVNGDPVFNGDQISVAGSGREYVLEPDNGSGQGVIDFSAATASGTFTISSTDDIAYWRTVSSGLQVKLLNSQEQDDGWWEACRVVVPKDYQDWTLTTNGDLLTPARGTLAPIGLIDDLATRAISNDSSYSTGLLRDLHRVQFETHPVKDFHDFINPVKDFSITTPTDGVYTGTVQELRANTPTAKWNQFIDSSIDMGHDMVYLRLHCRPEASGGSQFHFNTVRNLEFQYEVQSSFNQFETNCHDIEGAMDAHTDAKKKNKASAHLQV